MTSKHAIARALAAAFLAGGIDEQALVDRGAQLLGKRWAWLRPLAGRVCHTFGGALRPRLIVLVEFLHADAGFHAACEKHPLELPGRWTIPVEMSPIAAATGWNLPPIRSTGELANWFGITAGELEWFADCKHLEYKRNQGRLRHYHYRALTKRFGHIRLIESPKPRLKRLQRRILTDILDPIPIHNAAHGFRHDHSVKTFSAPHVGQQVVARLDLNDFFPSIRVCRVEVVFRAVGYPDRVATLLASLCTNATPLDIWDDCLQFTASSEARNIRFLYAQPHLPQGAPTSPALANLCAFQLDCRLTGLATTAGGAYTRYADDLAFSGDANFSHGIKRFCLHAGAIVLEEGFQVHHRKTRIMRSSVRQRLAGLVVNQRLNVPRVEYDRIKATLKNCVRHGVAGQNRSDVPDFRAQLLGKISFVEMIHPARGERLRKMFDCIDW